MVSTKNTHQFIVLRNFCISPPNYGPYQYFHQCNPKTHRYKIIEGTACHSTLAISPHIRPLFKWGWLFILRIRLNKLSFPYPVVLFCLRLLLLVFFLHFCSTMAVPDKGNIERLLSSCEQIYSCKQLTCFGEASS